MSAFNDATCPKCKRRFGWVGDLKDCPPCPKCNYQIPPEEWDADEAEMKAFEEMLIKRKKARDDSHLD